MWGTKGEETSKKETRESVPGVKGFLGSEVLPEVE